MDRRRRPRWVLPRVESVEQRVLMSVAADRFEPNDSYAAATNLGTVSDRTESNLTIHAAGNNDYFQFVAAASGALSVSLTFDQSQGDVDAFLLDADRLLLDSSTNASSPERLDASVTAGKTYFVKVIGFGGATQPDYDMVIDGPAAPAGDTDDQLSEARALALDGSRTDSVSSGTDVDLYKLTVAAGQNVKLDVDRTSGSSLDSFLRVFNSSGTQIKSNDNANAPGETAATPKESYISYTFSTAGTYYVGVSGNPNKSYSPSTGAGDSSGSTGGYVLRVSATAPPAPGDSDDQIGEARSLSIGSSVGDSIGGATDVDMFKFTATAGQRIGFDVDPASDSALDSFLRVFNSSGTRLTSNNDRAAPGETLGKSSYLEYTFATAGTYYVGVSGNPNSSYNAATGAGDVAGSTGGYRLFLVNRTAAVQALAVMPTAAARQNPLPTVRVMSLAMLDDANVLHGRLNG
jgi:hypothetical protein